MLQSALTRAKDHPTLLYHLGVAHHRVGDRQAARRHLQQALSGAGDFPEAAQARRLLDQL